MSSLNLNNFVDINIVKKSTYGINSIRDTIVLFSNEQAQSVDDNGYEEYDSLSSFESRNGGITELVNTKKYLEIFFSNGGNVARVYYNKSDISSTDIDSLPDEIIVITSTLAIDKLKKIAETCSGLEGIKKKIFVGRTTDISESVDFEESSQNQSYNNLALKYSNVEGAEMTIAAYLSNIDIYGIDTVHDYSFTVEMISAEDISNEDYTNLLTNNINVDLNLADRVRNVGGNLTNGDDLVNSFMLIVLHQTLTNRLINLLTNKIKGSSGLSAIYSTIAQEMNRYVNNGYITTDKVWRDETLNIVGPVTGNKYTIIEKNTPLLQGYIIKVLPVSEIDYSDSKHSAPPIYVILADSYSIRYIKVDGEVI